MARGLVDRLRVQPGEKALDIGSGRGAVTRPLAEDVGPTGRVDAVDLAPGMVRLLGEDTAHLAARARHPEQRRRPAASGAAVRRDRLVDGDLLPRRPDRGADPLAGVAPSGRPRRGRDLPAVGRRLERAGRAPRRVRRGSAAHRRPLGHRRTGGGDARPARASPMCTPRARRTRSRSRTSTSGGAGRGRPPWAGCGGGRLPPCIPRSSAAPRRSSTPRARRTAASRSRRPPATPSASA